MDEFHAQVSRALGPSYRLERELGVGGMSRVFVATEVALHRRVAVKVLAPELGAGFSLERFRREIQVAASLQHPHIVPVLTAGEGEGLRWYTMPLVQGRTLRERMAAPERPSFGESLAILRDVADALAHAHRHGVVHRDIKPENILLAEGHAVVTDFGIARAVEEGTGTRDITQTGTVLGTPAYMSPEQAAGDGTVDHRADIYAWGCIAYELLSGFRVAVGATPQAVIASHLIHAPPPLRERTTSVPPALADLVDACLAKAPADRPQDASHLVASLEAERTPGSRLIAPVRSHRRSARWIVAGGVLVAALAGWSVWRDRHAEDLDSGIIAIAPFRVEGASSALASLRDGIPELIAMRLSTGGAPRAAEQGAVFTSWTRETSDDQADLMALRRIARSVRAATVLTGAAIGSPERITITATPVNVRSGVLGTPAEISGPPDSLPWLIDRLTVQLVLRAVGDPGDLTASSTTSAEAFKHYLTGRSLYRAGKYTEAIQAFGAARTVDTNFVQAAVAEVLAWNWEGSPPNSLRLALAHLEPRLGRRERAMVGRFIGGRDRAYDPLAHVAELAQLVASEPEHAELRLIHGMALLTNGAERAIPNWLPDAMAELKEATRLAPSLTPARSQLLFRAVLARDTAAVREWTQGRPLRLSERYLAALARGQGDTLARLLSDTGWTYWEARRTILIATEFGEVSDRLVRLNQLGADKARTVLFQRVSEERGGMLLFTGGRPEAAFRAWGFRPALATAADSAIQRFMIARYLGTGRPSQADARRWLERKRERDGAWARTAAAIFDLCAAQFVRDPLRFARAGSEHVAALNQVPDTATIPDLGTDQVLLDALTYTWRAETEGGAALRVATEHLDSVALHSPGGPSGYRGFVNLELARLFEAQGDPRRALEAIRRRYYYHDLTGWFLSTWRVDEGRLALAAADTAAAIEAWQKALVLRAGAEPAVRAEVERVRREYARLIGEPRGD